MTWMGHRLEEFEPLRPAERKLVAEMASGMTVVLGHEVPSENADPDLRLRASFVRYLALGGCEACRPPEKGVSVRGAYIEGDGPEGGETRGLDLEGCILQGDLRLFRCRIPDQILLRGTSIESLFLDRSCLSVGISGERLTARGNLLLRHATVAGIVRITQAKIGGGLDCDGSTIQATEVAGEEQRVAIEADGLEVGGSVFLRGVKVSGPIRLISAKIGGQLACNGSKFTAEKDAPAIAGVALAGDSLEVGGGVFLDDADVLGEMRLPGAKIGGDFQCPGGRFRALHDAAGKAGNAILADRLEVHGAVLFRKTQVVGVVRMYGGTFGSLECSGASFRAEKDTDGTPCPALLANRLRASRVKFSEVHAKGEVCLLNARVGTLECIDSTFVAERDAAGKLGHSFSADGIAVEGLIVLSGVEAEGEFRLLSARVGGAIQCGGRFSDGKNSIGEPGYALSLDGVEVAGRIDLRRVSAIGEVTFLGARVASDLKCEDCRFISVDKTIHRAGRALNLARTRIQGTFFLVGPHQVKGILDATDAVFGSIVDDPACWPPKGCLRLNGCRYGGFATSAVDVPSRLDWLDRQYPPGEASRFLPQPHEQLARVLREAGHEDQSKTVLVAKARALRTAELRRVAWWRKPPHWASTQLLWMVGYGYRPALALGPAIVVWLLGWCLIDRAADAGVLIAAKSAELGAPATVLVPAAYFFETFVPIANLGQAEAFRPDMTKPWGYRLQVYLWVHALLGWLLGGLAVAGVLGFFRKE